MRSQSPLGTRVPGLRVGIAVALVTAAAISTLPGPARAALTVAETKCKQRAGIEGRVLLKNVQKQLGKCLDKVSKGLLPPMTDCALDAGVAAAITKAEAKLTQKIVATCSDAVVAGLVFGGDCYGTTTGADLASCLIDTHEAQAFALAATVYANSGSLPAPQQKCQAAVSKETQKYLGKRHKLIAGCKDKVNGGKLPGTTDCAAYTAAKVDAAAAKSAAKIPTQCADAVVAALPLGAPCTGATTGTGLAACAVGVTAQRDDALITVEYGAGPTGTTSALKLITDAASECVKGPLSRCRNGDYLISNDRIRVVVQSVQRNLFGVGQYGGQIIDADLVRTGLDPDRDNFEEWSTSLNIENTAHYTNLTIVNDGSDGQAAILRATGVDDLLDFINPSTVVADFGFPFPAAANDTDLPVEIVTDYVLEPGRNWVRVETTVHNTGASPLSIYFGEYLNGSGHSRQFQGAYGFGSPTITLRCPVGVPNPCNTIVYAGVGEGMGVSYGYTNEVPQSSAFSTAGVAVPLIGTEVVLAVIGAATPPWTMTANGSPGDSITFRRYFIVGDGSVSSVLDARNRALLLPAGRIEGTVTAGGVGVPGLQVTVLGPGSGGPTGLTRNVVTHAYTDMTGRYSASVAPGTYQVMANVEGSPFEGGGSTPAEHTVSVAAYGTVTRNMAIPATGTLVVNLVDETSSPIPGKVTVVGFDPSPTPRNTQSIFGLINVSTSLFMDGGPDALPFGLAQAHFMNQSGTTGAVALEPGSYQVVVSRGQEFSVDKHNVTITAGATTTVNAKIARVIDSPGFVTADFHVHSIDSPDSEVSRSDRVKTVLAEGLDFFTPSDHDIRTSFQPDVDAMGATALVGTAVSGEITTFDYGHFNAWPMTIDPLQVNGGSVDHGGAAPAGFDFPAYGYFNLTPAQIVAAAKADPGTNTVQLNHIHSHFGIDGNSGLAIDTGVSPPASPSSSIIGPARRLDPSIPNYFDASYDAMEVWIGDDRGHIYTYFLGQNAGDWFNLLNQGIVRTGVSDSDTHGKVIVQVGSPRNYVASPTDDPGSLSAIAETLSANVNDGRSVGTNGPFVRITADAASTAQTAGLDLALPTLISTTDGNVTVTVDVQSPTWAEFDKVELYVNSTTTRSTTTKESGNGPVSVKRYAITPDYTQNVSPTLVNVHPSVPGADRLEATAVFNLTGLTEDVWIVAMVKGTDGVSRPLFPVSPNSLRTTGNTTLANLTDGNLGELGMTTLAFTNPLFVDVDGGGWTAPGLRVNP
ncbi:MAG: CehA/McbA family metallohydrolase [bacterium]|nr:CehA/McbA family metallohydrolase [bacterium]